MKASTTTTAIHIQPRPRIGCGPNSSFSHPIDMAKTTRRIPARMIGSAVVKKTKVAEPGLPQIALNSGPTMKKAIAW